MSNLSTKDSAEAYKKLLKPSGYNYQQLEDGKDLDYKFCWDYIIQQIPRKVIVNRYEKIRKELDL